MGLLYGNALPAGWACGPHQILFSSAMGVAGLGLGASEGVDRRGRCFGFVLGHILRQTVSPQHCHCRMVGIRWVGLQVWFNVKFHKWGLQGNVLEPNITPGEHNGPFELHWGWGHARGAMCA